MKRPVLLLFSFLLMLLAARAQTIPCLQYGVEDGLGHSIVYNAFQDSKGYMWFCTDHGLSKFDGQHFTNYTTSDGLPTDYIMSVAETSDGVLWIATYGYGVYTYQKGRFAPCKPDNKDVPSILINILADKKDRIWIYHRGSFDTFVWRIENNKFKKITINDYTKDTVTYVIHDLFEREDGSVLFATSKGVFALKDDNLKRVADDNSPVYIMDEDRLGNLWFGSVGKIIEVTADMRIRIVKSILKPDEVVYVLEADDEGRLWIGDYVNSCLIINAADGKIVGREDTHMNSTYRDRENNIWIATFGQGVLCYNALDIMNYTVKDGLTNNMITGIAEDSKGRIWTASRISGISYLANDSEEKQRAVTVVDRGEIFGFLVDKQDELFYSYGPRLLMIKNGVTKKVETMNNKQIRSLYEDTDGKIWIAIGIGIAYYQHDSVVYPKALSAFNKTKNLAIRRGSKGKLWIATDDGVYSYDGVSIVHYGTHEGLSNNVVNSIWEDTRQRMWFATNEGISVLDNGKWVHDSLLGCTSHSLCTSFAGDKNNNVWIGTNNGLFAYDGKTIQRFDNHNGLPGVEVQSLYTDSKNCLWVGTIKGLSRIDLNMYSHISSSYQPPVYIQSVKVNNKDFEIVDSSSCSLEHSENNIRITYAGLSFKNPYTISYEYKLDGAFITWVKTTGNTVEFSALPPGRYQFLVKAISANGIYSKYPASFSFTILPPFWLRPWFRIIEVILLIIIISILFRWRLYIYKRKEVEKLERHKLELDRQRIEKELLNAQNALTEFTQSMEEKNVLLEQFKTDIEKLKDLKSNDIDDLRVKQLEHLNKATILTKEDWDKFRILFEQVHKGYFERLRNKLPDLTQAEVRLVCLTKLGLDTKQMAGILGVSFYTITQTRYRLRKKMGLKEEDSIDDIAGSI